MLINTKKDFMFKRLVQQFLNGRFSDFPNFVLFKVVRQCLYNSAFENKL